jgi:hypothetical protein
VLEKGVLDEGETLADMKRMYNKVRCRLNEMCKNILRHKESKGKDSITQKNME